MALPLHRHSLRRKDLDVLLNSVLQDRLVGGEFAKLLARQIGLSFGLEVVHLYSSPSLAVKLLLRQLGIGPEDAVVLSPLAPPYWSQGLTEAGVQILWWDVAERSPVLEIPSGGAPLPSNLRAVVADTCLGYQPDYARLNELGVFRIHDASQGLGGEADGRPLPCWGDAVLLHFGADSILAGSGGCVVGLRGSAAVGAEALSVAPWDQLSDVAASLLHSQWPDLQELAQGKTAAFHALFLKLAKGFAQPRQAGDSMPVCPVFPVLAESGAKEILAHARRHSVEADWAFRDQSLMIPELALDQCPHARYFVQHTLAFPLYSRFSGKELESLGKVLASLP